MKNKIKLMMCWLIILCLLLTSGCVSEKHTVRTLEKASYTDIEITGLKLLSCSDDDFFMTGFKAKNPNGKIIEGVVCCGLIFKSCTIRY